MPDSRVSAQVGFPIVHVEVTSTSLKLRQERFTCEGDTKVGASITDMHTGDTDFWTMSEICSR